MSGRLLRSACPATSRQRTAGGFPDTPGPLVLDGGLRPAEHQCDLLGGPGPVERDDELCSYTRSMTGPDWRGLVETHRQRAALWQRVLNERPIPRRDAQRDFAFPVDVTAWVVWERDGLELIDTTAHVWAGRDVMVRLADDRRDIAWVWLAAQDVRRR